ISDISRAVRRRPPTRSSTFREERPTMLVRLDHGPGVARALLAGESEGVKERGSLVHPEIKVLRPDEIRESRAERPASIHPTETQRDPLIRSNQVGSGSAYR